MTARKRTVLAVAVAAAGNDDDDDDDDDDDHIAEDDGVGISQIAIIHSNQRQKRRRISYAYCWR